jgi:hypothetical protein
MNRDQSIDRKSFILGMMTAFAECLAHECKRAALSSPFYAEDYPEIQSEAERIAHEHGLLLWYEENADLPALKRVHWFVLYKYPDVLEEYKAIRKQGLNPVWDLDAFSKWLSYGTVWGEGAEKVVPRMREETVKDEMPTVMRILFKRGDWPIARS